MALWGIVDTQGLATFASAVVGRMFISRGWFIMLSVSAMLIIAVYLAFSRYGRIKLGRDDDQPEFSTVSWLTMLFACRHGRWASLLGRGGAHLALSGDSRLSDTAEGGYLGLVRDQFSLGSRTLWAIYAVTALVIAYFGFPQGLSHAAERAPLLHVFGRNRWTRGVGWLSDLLAIYAIAIGLGGSVAMGVFQVQKRRGIAVWSGEDRARYMAMVIFVLLVISYILPLTVDLSQGMARLSNTAMAIAGGLVVFVLLTGPDRISDERHN